MVLLLSLSLFACDSGEDPKQTEIEGESATESNSEISSNGESEDENGVEFENSVQITEVGGLAEVVTELGLKYSARGYYSLEGNVFAVKDKLEINFDGEDPEEVFNRIGLNYVSNAPVKCVFTYTENGETLEDVFFLEAGKKNFYGLTRSYISGISARDLDSVRIEPFNENGTEFMLYDVTSSQSEVFETGIYYFENERFKVGLRLAWGGGISYIEDKACSVTKLKNMINIHDAGRLVQQSYYGTPGNDEYQPGVYNENNWVYNPVQGGDQYWNHSRLIDIRIGEDFVYVKSQPQDWSLDNKLTPSYMENTYTIYSDRIVVDNRFVDFSGWEHRFAHQELPAFYTVSYLDRFTYYNGLEPWSGGELINHDNLTFDHVQSYFKLLESNTETWCAWTNATDDYGIGLYVPNTDMFLAARFQDGSSKSPKDNSCSYVAPVNTLIITSFVPMEYSYMITAGSIEEIRGVFYQNRDFADNSFLSSQYSSDIRLPNIDVSYTNINFATAEHNKYLLPMNSAEMKFNSNHNAVELLIGGDGIDPQINILYGDSNKALKASDYGKIVIEYMIPSTNSRSSYSGQLFLCTGGTVNAEEGKSLNVDYIADGAYHVVELELGDLDFWRGRINSVRFDFFNFGEVGDKIFVKSIKLVE